MTLREMELVIAGTFGTLALLSAYHYRNLWHYLRLARGGTRQLLWAFGLLVSMVALTMAVWAVAFIAWPAPRPRIGTTILYSVLWIEHLGLVAVIGYLYKRMTANGS